MKRSSTIFLFCILAGLYKSATTQTPAPEPPLGSYPSDIIGQILDILYNGTVTLTGGCDEPEPSDVSFYLFTRDNPNDPIAIDETDFSELDPEKPIKLVVHGYISNAFNEGGITLKDQYLIRYDCNVILVDWSELANQLYTTAYCDYPYVSERIADFSCALKNDLSIDLDTLHVLGHSLGAHISGRAGQLVFSQCNDKYGRITGLDPAGPLFQGSSISNRLDETDAESVDIIHTNSGVFGIVGQIGTVDFYVNCGTVQPVCVTDVLSLPLSDLLNLPFSIIACPHSVAWYYMAESINSNSIKFISHSCIYTVGLCILYPFYPNIRMGENCPPSPSYDEYYTVILSEPLYNP